jgi:hypothetical protein
VRLGDWQQLKRMRARTPAMKLELRVDAVGLEDDRLLRKGPGDRAEELIVQGLRRGRRGACLCWASIALTARLGIAKPF